MARKGAMGGVGGGGGGGLDFSMLFSNTVLLGTLGLAALAWIIAFIGQIAAEANNARQQTLWFNIFLQLFLMIGIALAIMSNNIAVHRLQICMFLAVALVFSVIGINQGIYSNVASQNAVTAGWFILTIINIIWLLFFSADEDSLIYGMLSGFGNGSLGGPGGRASRGGGAGISRMGGGNMNNGNGYGGGFGSGQGMNGGYQPTYGQGPSAADVTMSAPKSNGMIGGPGSIRSAHTHHTAAGAGGAVGASSSKPEFGQAGDLGRAASPTSTNKHSAVGTTEAAGEPSAGYGYRARALYAYTANADDPTEISFSKGEILDIVDNSGKWWQARKPNGETGIVPSNYMQVL